MKIDKKDIKRILLITLTNIGDIILTTPLINVLDKEFPDARLDIIVGPLGREIFINHPRVFKVIVYNKHMPLSDKRRLIRKLRSMKYDLVVDLKNSLFPILIGPRYRTSPIQLVPKDVLHKKEFHLWKLKSLGIEADDAPFSVYVSKEDTEYIDALLEKVPHKERIVTVSPTAKSLIKRWEKNGFTLICERLMKELDVSIVMVGDRNDMDSINEIIDKMEQKPFNLAGMTTIPQLASLLKRSKLLITNDSAPLHVGAAAGTNTLAIFGPTDEHKYGPRGRNDKVIRKKVPCAPCELAQCKFKHECMRLITADEVYEAAKKMLKA